jgi:hypothetical protein
MVREVRWPLIAQKQLEKAYNYVLSDSYQNAVEVKMQFYYLPANLLLILKCFLLINTGKIMMEVLEPLNCIITELLTGLQKMKLLLFVFDIPAWNQNSIKTGV